MTSFSARLKHHSRSLAFATFAPVVRVWENHYFKGRYEELPDNLAPVFIIGAPRTGSTILYQSLTNRFLVLYVDNMAATWYRNLRFGLWLSGRAYGAAPHQNFDAEFGNTSQFGGHAPNECGEFWYRWLPKRRHFIDHHEVDKHAVDEIRREVGGITAHVKTPLLFKNLNAGQRLRFIARAFPNARFIFIRRDPRFTVRSILSARKRLGCKPSDWWSLMPSNVEALRALPEAMRCAAQVYFLEKQIEQDLNLFPSCNVREIHYQQLSISLLDGLAEWLGIDARSHGQAPAFSPDQLASLTAPELRSLDELVSAFPFGEECFI